MSAFRRDRKNVKSAFGSSFPIQNVDLSSEERMEFLEMLRKAVYAAFLTAFVQGINIIDQANRENKWQIDFSIVVQIWRNGCIIKADHIIDLLDSVFQASSEQSNRDPQHDWNILHNPLIAEELKRNFPSLKSIVTASVATNAIIPSLSATLEYLKYSASTELPTGFYEAQLDYFGKHMFDQKGEQAELPTTGKHHFEWKPA